MKECSKSIARRRYDINFVTKYFVGAGVDIGGKPDPLSLYTELFPNILSVKTWDWEDGDAQKMASVQNQQYDFVHSSHCLEHLVDPVDGLANWFRTLKKGGYLVVTVPDEDMYEQGVFPSTFNLDHKWTFTPFKMSSWSDKSISVIELLKTLGIEAEIVKIEQITAGYRYDLPRFDQTLAPVTECAIEFIIRKRTDQELVDKGAWRRPTKQPVAEVKIHLNQYKDDMASMKSNNTGRPPFTNQTDL
jgi:SAM-dependent methyltransferase